MTKTDLFEKPLSRRAALAGIGAATVALAAPKSSSAADDKLVMANGGGKLGDAYRAAIYNPWTKKTGTEIVTTGNNLAQLKAMVEQKNVQWDLVQGPAEGLTIYARDGLFEPIDYSVVDKSKLAPGSAREHFVMTDYAAYHVAWNTKNVKSNPPKDWKELFALSGRIGMLKRPFQTLEAALLADGVELAKLYPLDLDRAFAALTKVKSKILFWDTGAQGAQILIDGEVDAGAIWNGRVAEPMKSGAPVNYHLNQAVLVCDAWAVPKGAPHKDKAMQLLAYSVTAPVQAEYSKAIPYGPVNQDALAMLSDADKERLPRPGPTSVVLDVDYWAANLAKATERFNAWLLA